MATEPQKIYPRGFIAMDSGDLIDVTNVKHDIVNNAKQVHTIRQTGAGVTLGVEETTISFDAVVSEDGPERDYLRFLKRGTLKQIRIKIPGETISINGIFTTRGMELPLDSEIKFSLTFIGKTED